MGWIVAIIYFSKLGFFYYFALYRVMIVSLAIVFMHMKVYRLKGIKRVAGYIDYILVRVLLILRVGGVPPFTGFFIKVYGMYLMVWDGWVVLAIIFCLFATMGLSYYINLIFSSLLFCVFPSTLAILRRSMDLGAKRRMRFLCVLAGVFSGVGLCLVRGLIL
jgi:NADH:ubiquinone oxidoreductase subunit 2 (subunit N)